MKSSQSGFGMVPQHLNHSLGGSILTGVGAEESAGAIEESVQPGSSVAVESGNDRFERKPQPGGITEKFIKSLSTGSIYGADLISQSRESSRHLVERARVLGFNH